MERNPALRELNALLRGEMAAVEAYRRAFDAVAHFPSKGGLAECQRSHQERVQVLRTTILRLGGTPVESAGMWGALASLFERGATVLGDRAAIAALEQGEDRGLEEYRAAVAKLDGEARIIIERQLLPEQLKTQRTVSALKSSVHHA